MVERALTDIQCRQRRQKVVAYKEAKEHEVVYDSLQVEAHPHLISDDSVLKQEILSQY